eukprot:5474531-Prymnesium_polylepis.1
MESKSFMLRMAAVTASSRSSAALGADATTLRIAFTNVSRSLATCTPASSLSSLNSSDGIACCCGTRQNGHRYMWWHCILRTQASQTLCKHGKASMPLRSSQSKQVSAVGSASGTGAVGSATGAGAAAADGNFAASPAAITGNVGRAPSTPITDGVKESVAGAAAEGATTDAVEAEDAAS